MFIKRLLRAQELTATWSSKSDERFCHIDAGREIRTEIHQRGDFYYVTGHCQNYTLFKNLALFTRRLF